MFLPRQVKCDTCGKVIAENFALTVTTRFIQMGQPSYRHFCSWECLKEKASKILDSRFCEGSTV